MLFIVLVLGILSTAIGMCITLIYLNVVIRREGAYIVEERIAAIVDRSRAWLEMHVAVAEKGARSAARPLQDNTVTQTVEALPSWLSGADFSGLVMDRGQLEVRSVQHTSFQSRSAPMILHVPVNAPFLKDTAEAAGLNIVDARLQPVSEYRRQEGAAAEMLANFVPGSRRPVPVIVTVTDWSSGRRSDWVICDLQLNYRHTISDLSHMGLRTASWVSPVLFLSLTLLVLWLAGIVLSLHISNDIIRAVNALSRAARRIGEGDFSTEVKVAGEDQLAELAHCFNHMMQKLSSWREQERRTSLLERDLSLASEVQAFLTPTRPALLQGGTVWSTSTPARQVSGDLHEVIPYTARKVGLVCADISGKGVSSGLLMSHLQGLVHAHLRSADALPTPSALAEMLNSDLYAHSQQSRFATFFYAEADLDARSLTYVNAGHCSPILVDSHGSRLLPDGNHPLGLFPESTFQEFQVDLEAGSTLVVYTDGVAEAMNARNEEFGEERLLQHVSEAVQLGDAARIGVALRTDIAAWAEEVEQFDDSTLLVFHVSKDAYT